MDYHSIGFRECASETARYMVAVEGMDLQDPLRLRLMSHLQCYAAQRELALKSSAHASVWNPSAFTTPTQFPLSSHPPPTCTESSAVPLHGYSSHSLTAHSHTHTHSGLDPSLGSQLSGHMMPPPPLFKTSSSPDSSAQAQASAYNPNGSMVPVSQMPPNHHQYFPGYGHPPSGSGQQGGSVKHYRPWGAELAY